MKKSKFYVTALILVIASLLFSCRTQQVQPTSHEGKFVNPSLSTNPKVDPSVPIDENDGSIEGKKIFIPCQKESYDTDEYMAGLGISDNAGINDAQTFARRRAKVEIMDKYMSVFDVGLKEYAKDTHLSNGEKSDMSEIEGGVKSAARHAINAYSRKSCSETYQLENGNYRCYFVLRVFRSDVKNEVKSNLDQLKLEFNKDKFFKFVDEEIDSQNKFNLENAMPEPNDY